MRNVCSNCRFESDFTKRSKEIDVQKVEFIIHLAKHKPFKSLSDIKDAELKEILKDFDFSKLEDQKKCFHYSNLQPLWRKENQEKSDRI